MIQNDILQKYDLEWQFAKKMVQKDCLRMTKEWFANIVKDYHSDNLQMVLVNVTMVDVHMVKVNIVDFNMVDVHMMDVNMVFVTLVDRTSTI